MHWIKRQVLFKFKFFLQNGKTVTLTPCNPDRRKYDVRNKQHDWQFFIKTVAIGIYDINTRNQLKISNLDEVRYKCLINLDSYMTAWNKYFAYYNFFVSYFIVEICIIIQKASF